MHDYSKLISYLSQYGISVSDDQIKQLDTYYEMMIETNKSLNLTAITEFDEVIVKHYIDSVTIVRDIDMSGKKSVIDVGTGAGFPGMVLKIIFPELNITLFDSLQKRLNFLEEVISTLGLKDISTYHGRAEEAGGPLRPGAGNPDLLGRPHQARGPLAHLRHCRTVTSPGPGVGLPDCRGVGCKRGKPAGGGPAGSTGGDTGQLPPYPHEAW